VKRSRSVSKIAESFREGFISPIMDAIYSLAIFTFIFVLKSLAPIAISDTGNQWLSVVNDLPTNAILFLVIFSTIATLEGVVTDIFDSSSFRIHAPAKIAGIVCGTIMFWVILVAITTNIGGSMYDLGFSFVIAIAGPLIGMSLSDKIHNR